MQLHSMELSVSMPSFDVSHPIETTDFHALCYMRLSVLVDISLNTGYLPGEEDLSSKLWDSTVDEACQVKPVMNLYTRPRRLESPGRGQTGCNACGELTPRLPSETGLQAELLQIHSDMRSFEGDIAIEDFFALESAFSREVEDNREIELWWESGPYTEFLTSTSQLEDWFNGSDDQGCGPRVIDYPCLDEAYNVCWTK